MNKIIRSLCYFSKHLDDTILPKLDEVQNKLLELDYEIQTRRVCFGDELAKDVGAWCQDPSLFLSVGTLDSASIYSQLDQLLSGNNIGFNLDLTQSVEKDSASLLFEIIKQAPTKTFNFTFTLNNPPSSPYFPSASYSQPGFSLGLQSTDLADDCRTLEEWLSNMKFVWNELLQLFFNNPEFLGIDSSIAPLFTGKSSFIRYLKEQKGSFSKSVTTDIFLKITEFIKSENPKPIGLCGIMLPCLEDFELAEEYQSGRFPLERNIFLSLHSGLGIDTYPIGIDESPERVMEILSLLQLLSAKYQKALSARFVSDGKSRIGEKSDFQNQYLKDVVIRKL